MKTKLKIVPILLIIAILLSGCFGEKKVLEPLQEGKGKIKVMCYNEEFLREKYGNFFNVKYPDIELEAVSLAEMERQGERDEGIKKWIEQKKPDVLLLDEKMFTSYAQEGKLYDLGDIIEDEQFDLEGYMPGFIEMLKAKGNGKLYGLSPSFYVSVLYYNRDLFQKYNVDLPRNKMSWQEVLDLSKRFGGIGSGKEQVFGLYERYGDITQFFFQNIVGPSSLQLFDTRGEKLLIHSESWKQAVKLATDAVRSKAVHFPAPRNNNDRSYYDDDAFRAGKAAMIIDGPWRASELKDAQKYDKKAKKINWDIVTAPTDPKTPDESGYVQLHGIFAISADSSNKRAAWEFVKFVNGSDMAKASSRSRSSDLPTRNQFFKEIDGKSTEAFYLLKPKSQDSSFWSNRNVPMKFFSLFQPLLTEALQAIVDNKKNVDDALAELAVKGQSALVQAREAEKKEKSSAAKTGGE